MVVKEKCEHCLSVNYLEDNVENLGYEAYECWNCHERSFLPDQGLYRFMDRMCVEETEALQYITTGFDVITVDGRSVA